MWCKEAVQKLDRRFGKGNYYLATAERGARNIRRIMGLWGLEVRPFWANSQFFLSKGIQNWDEIRHYFDVLDLSADKILADKRQLVILDTGMQGNVIRGFIEYTLLGAQSAESNNAYASRIAKAATAYDEVVVIGFEDFGLRNLLREKGIRVSSFLDGDYRLTSLNAKGGPSNIDRIVEGDKKIAEEYYSKILTTAWDKIKKGKKILFVTAEVNPKQTEFKALLGYLRYKNVRLKDHGLFHRKINREQKKLLSRMYGFMATAYPGSLYEELIGPDPKFPTMAWLFEESPQLFKPVSRENIEADGKICFEHLSPHEQLVAIYGIEKLMKSSGRIRRPF